MTEKEQKFDKLQRYAYYTYMLAKFTAWIPFFGKHIMATAAQAWFIYIIKLGEQYANSRATKVPQMQNTLDTDL
jgi:hypothetical protein